MGNIKIYTDGACSGNQSEKNFGGYGAFLEYGEHSKEIYGGERNTTNNRMELMAVIVALEALKHNNIPIEIYTDSSYVANCFREEWYKGWIKNGWKTAGKKPVENQDLWEKLIGLVEPLNIKFYRVKGHVNVNSKAVNLEKLFEKFKAWNGKEFDFQDFKHITEMNNIADGLAVKGAEELKVNL